MTMSRAVKLSGEFRFDKKRVDRCSNVGTEPFCLEIWGLVTHDLQQDIKAHRQWAARLEAEAAEQRRQLEAQLRKNEARLQATLDTAVDDILTIDQHGIIETCNPAAAKMFGYAASKLLGKNIKALMPSP